MSDGMDRLIGQTIDGRFRLDRLLGTGGMGKVYYGVQLSVERPVAVKVLRSDLSELPSIQQRFFREAKVLASLYHPNVVGLVDFGRDDQSGALYMAMEYVDGKSLTDLVKAGRLPLAVSLTIARQICSGLAEAHAAGVVHRDLKPDNVMLQTTAEGTVVAKILDFGIALPTGKDETRFTSTGAIVGTPFYMSPEQAQDQPVGPQSDIYSVGVILYEMLTGDVPFSGDTPLAVMFKTVNERHTPIQEILELPRVRGPLGDLVDELLDKDMMRRPSSASDVARRLDDIRAGLEVPVVPNVETLDTMVQPALRPTGAGVTRPPNESPQERVDDGPVDTSRGPAKKSRLPMVALAVFVVMLVPVTVMVVLVAGGIWLAGNDTMGSSSVAGPVAYAPSPEGAEPAADLGSDESADSEVDESKPAEAGKVARTETSASLDAVASARQDAPAEPVEPAAPAAPVQPAAQRRDSAPRPDLKDRAAPAGACQRGTCKVNLTAADAHYACQHATCIVDCAAGGCGQVCQAESTCTFNCTGGGCRQTCFGGTTCDLSCSGGGCDRTLFDGADVAERD